MQNGSGADHSRIEFNARNQEETPINRTNMSINQQSKQNPSKRYKGGGDDSFEHEHRLALDNNKYFNSNNYLPSTTTTTSSRIFDRPDASTRHPNFPPFRIELITEELPSELAIIKDINKYCKISLSYGRFSAMGTNKNFLIYANSSDQFERLLNKNLWPQTICSCKYKLDIPTKVPTSYSLIATGIPAQWDLTDFELDVKKQYPSIIRVERMRVRGGTPIAKVRIDFSSNDVVQKLLKNKRLVLDDENTSFAVQQYHPPFKILRCYNCHQYNDHVASNCPDKENPICFRCSQNHPYNPNCSNKIRCANCGEGHLAGNPSCRIKIAERIKCKPNRVITAELQSNKNAMPLNPWPNTDINTNIRPIINSIQPSTATSASKAPENANNRCSLLEISNKLDIVLNKINHLSVEYDSLKANAVNVAQQLEICQESMNALKIFITDHICPLIVEVGEGITGKKQDINKKKIRPLISNFNQGRESLTRSFQSSSRQASSPSLLKKSISMESIDNDL